MTNHRLLPLVATIVLFSSVQALAGNFKVIANRSVKASEISVDELEKVFLLQKITLKDGTHVEPVLRKSGAVHESFTTHFLNVNGEALQTYYRTLVFTGRASMPKTLGSDAEVVAYVSRTRGAIGYVSPETDTEGTNILTIVSQENHSQRVLLTRVEPDYPQTLQKLQIGGTVRLSITIAARGSVEDVALLGGNPILAESAIQAVQKWVYAPGPSRTKVEVTIPFDPHR